MAFAYDSRPFIELRTQFPCESHAGDGFHHSPMPPIRIRLYAAKYQCRSLACKVKTAGSRKLLDQIFPLPEVRCGPPEFFSCMLEQILSNLRKENRNSNSAGWNTRMECCVSKKTVHRDCLHDARLFLRPRPGVSLWHAAHHQQLRTQIHILVQGARRT